MGVSLLVHGGSFLDGEEPEGFCVPKWLVVSQVYLVWG